MEKNIKNICIYGVGGVGGYFGTKIIKGNSDKRLNITFIARGKHLEEIKNNGLVLNEEEQRLRVFPDCVTENISELDDFDLIILCVKSYDLDKALESMQEKVNSETLVLPLLNGIDVYERIRKILKKGIVLPACVYVGTHIEKPGVILQKGGDGKIIFGKDPEKYDYCPEEIIKLFKQVNINYIYEENPHKEIWTKYMFIAAYGLVTAYTGKTMGEVLKNNNLLEDIEGIMNEIKVIADKKGIDLDKDVISKSLNKAKIFPYDTKTSFQRDVENPNKKNEGSLFGGTIIRMAQEYGVDINFTSRYYKYQ